MLQLRANKKLVQAELQKTAKVSLKDIHNIGAELSSADTLKEAMTYFANKDTGVVVVVKNEENVFQGIFYQDEEMRKTFQSFPELIFVDAIYKVSTRGMGLYIFGVQNSNGETEIVAFFLSASEEAPIISEMVKLFKKHNPAWTQTKTIMTDKDMVERDTFKEEFPQAKTLLCLFHTLRTFRREITTEKMGISTGERSTCLEIAQKMAYAKNEDEYNELFNDMNNLKYDTFIKYMEKNWHPIRSEWVVSLQNAVTYQNRTNNRLESINSKVVQVVRRHSILPDMFRDLDILLISLRTERDRRAALTIQKVPLNVSTPHEGQKEYLSLLTPYAYGILCKRYELLNKVKIVESLTDGEYFTVVSSEGNLLVSPTSCTCSFFNGMQLPCHHLLQIRSIKGLSMFCSTLVATRWTKNYYVNNSRLVMVDRTQSLTSLDIDVNTVKTKKIMTQHEKFSLISSKVKKLSSLASEVSSRIFPQRLEVLEKIISLWERNIEVHVQGLEEGDGDENDMELEEAILNNVEQNTEDYGVFETEIETVHNVVDLNCENQKCEEKFRDNNLVENVIGIGQTTSKLELTKPDLNANVWTENGQSFLIPTIPVVKKRGRPKGNDLTVVGLPRKKLKENKVKPFERKHPRHKDEIVLGWFVTNDNVRKAIDGGSILDECAIEHNPHKISMAVFNSNVDISKIQKYFTKNGWHAIEHVLNIKFQNPLWLCPRCSKCSKEHSICCNSCLERFHLQCCNLMKVPKKKWYCRACYVNTTTVML